MNGLPTRSHLGIGICDMEPSKRRGLIWQFLGAFALTGALGILAFVAGMLLAGN